MFYRVLRLWLQQRRQQRWSSESPSGGGVASGGSEVEAITLVMFQGLHDGGRRGVRGKSVQVVVVSPAMTMK